MVRGNASKVGDFHVCELRRAAGFGAGPASRSLQAGNRYGGAGPLIDARRFGDAVISCRYDNDNNIVTIPNRRVRRDTGAGGNAAPISNHNT